MINKVISRAGSSWTKQEGQYNNIVISSRIRLARNLVKVRMPLFQDENEANIILDKLDNIVNKAKDDKDRLYFYRLQQIPEMEKRILVEKHLISQDHSRDIPGKGLILNEDESISIMVNEEDHIRIQVLFSGLQLEKAWENAEKIDNLIEAHVEYAFDEKRGYLTACPTNVGTGLRASVMMHLPALTITKQIAKLFNTLRKLGFVVRGQYGEGSEAKGSIYQISNQITLGEKETEIIQNLTDVTKQLVEKEEEMRRTLLREIPLQVHDRVGRAYGILSNAAILSSDEAFELLSDVRLGLDLNLIKKKEDLNLTELLVLTQPAFLQKYAGRTMDSLERDAVRAQIFKEKLVGKGGM